MRTQPIPRQKKGPNGEPLCRWCQGPVPKGRRTFCCHTCVHEALLRSDPGYLRRQTFARDKGVCAICGRDTDAMKQLYHRLVMIAKGGIQAYDRLEKKAAKRWSVDPQRLETILQGITAEEAAWQVEREQRYASERWDRYQRCLANPDRHRWPRHVPVPTGPDDGVEACRMKWAAKIPSGKLENRILMVDKRLRRLAEARRIRLEAEWRAEGFHAVRRHQASNLWQADHILPVAEGGGGCGLDNIQTACTVCHKRKTADQARRKAMMRKGLDPDAPPPQLNLPL